MPPQRRTRLFMTLAWIVVGLQAILFIPIDHHLPPRSKALYQYQGTDDIIEISLLEDPNPMSRYGVWVAMAEIAPGSTFYHLNPSDLTTAHRAYAFGLADEVIEMPTVSRGYDDDGFLEYVVATGEGALKGPPWMVAIDPANGVGGDASDPAGFLTNALDGDSRGTNPGPPREFVLLAWRGQPVTDGSRDLFDFYNVLIEVSLLSDQERAHFGLDEQVN